MNEWMDGQVEWKALHRNRKRLCCPRPWVRRRAAIAGRWFSCTTVDGCEIRITSWKRWWTSHYETRVSTILAVMQDFATIHGMVWDSSWYWTMVPTLGKRLIIHRIHWPVIGWFVFVRCHQTWPGNPVKNRHGGLRESWWLGAFPASHVWLPEAN